MFKKPRVCVLSDYSLREFDPAVYFDGYEWEMFMPKNPLVEFLQKLQSSGRFDVYLNLCDGSNDKRFRYDGVDVVRALEELNLPFTGATVNFYDPSRETMQVAADVTISYDHHGFFERIFRSAVLRRNERLLQYSIPNEVAHADLRSIR